MGWRAHPLAVPRHGRRRDTGTELGEQEAGRPPVPGNTRTDLPLIVTLRRRPVAEAR